MIIFVESGVLYFLFFVSNILTYHTSLLDFTNIVQLSAVIGDSGDVGELETSTKGLAFASDVWTYMTSHILVRPSLAPLSVIPLPKSMLQGIYPLVIVILVHTQKSYIDETTATVVPSYGHSTNMSRTVWSGIGKRLSVGCDDCSVEGSLKPVQPGARGFHQTYRVKVSSDRSSTSGRNDTLVGRHVDGLQTVV